MTDPISPASTRHVVVMGAGPAGLSAAYELTRHGAPVTVIEKDPQTVGGIARTLEFMGCRFDVGPHRFFSKSAEIEALWTEVLGDDIRPVTRLTRIFYRGKFFDYPIRASNAFLGLGPVETARCLASYAQARLRPVADPKSFEDWVSNQFGHRLFEIFFKTYTEKVWGISTSELSADWAGQRIRGLNLVEVIRNAVLIAREIGPTYLQLYTPCILEIGKDSMEGLQEMRDSEKPTARFAFKEYVSEPAKQLLAELAAKSKDKKEAAKQLVS